MFKHAPTGGFDLNSKLGSKFAYTSATLEDGRTILCHFHCDVKGYDPGGTNWRLGRGLPPLDSTKDLFKEYVDLWRRWVKHNPAHVAELAEYAFRFDNTLSDRFATQELNQAKALAIVLNEKYGYCTQV